MYHTFLEKKGQEYLLRLCLSFWLPYIQPLIWMYEILYRSECIILPLALYIVDNLCIALNCLCDPYPIRRIVHLWVKLQSEPLNELEEIWVLSHVILV
jgi:hypothetical protein